MGFFSWSFYSKCKKVIDDTASPRFGYVKILNYLENYDGRVQRGFPNRFWSKLKLNR